MMGTFEWIEEMKVKKPLRERIIYKTFGICKICHKRKKIRFMNFCFSCYNNQMKIIQESKNMNNLHEEKEND